MRYDLTAKDERLTRALLHGQTKTKRKRGTLSPASPLYLLGSTLFAALGLFGLFAGFFLPSSVGRAIAGGEPIFRGSLFGVIVEIARGSIAMPLPFFNAGVRGVLPFFLYWTSILLALSAPIGLALTAFAFIRTKYARRICFFNGLNVLFIYGGLLFGSMLFLRAEGRFGLDAPPSAVFFSAAGLLLLFSLLRRGGKGAFQAALLFSSLLSLSAVCFPPLFSAFDSLFLGNLGGTQIALLAFLGVPVLNLALSAARLGGKGDPLFDLIRFSVQALFAAALTAVYAAEGSSLFAFFFEPYAAILLLLPPFAAILLSVIARVLLPHTNKKADSQAADVKTSI